MGEDIQLVEAEAEGVAGAPSSGPPPPAATRAGDRLEVSALEVHYGPLKAVRGVSFTVEPGAVNVLLGSNGAGKSSILRAIVGLEKAAAGTISFGGTDLKPLSAHRRARLGLGFLPEGRGVFPSMTVEENVGVAVPTGGDRAAALEAAFALFPRLAARRKQLAGTMSGGEQQMLSLARALACAPRLLILDELSLGLAPAIVGQLFAKIAELRDSGLSILLVEQFAHAALRVADQAGIVVRGEITWQGPAAELAALSPDELASLYFFGAHSDAAARGDGAAEPVAAALAASHGGTGQVAVGPGEAVDAVHGDGADLQPRSTSSG